MSRMTAERLSEVRSNRHHCTRLFLEDGLSECLDEIEALQAELSESRLDTKRLNWLLNPEGPRWFYAPCPRCGAIEGMGLVMRDQAVRVWCCCCEHKGPSIPNDPPSRDNDRTAVLAWNQEFADLFRAARVLVRELRDALDCIPFRLMVATTLPPYKTILSSDMVSQSINLLARVDAFLAGQPVDPEVRA
jgi:hypothetical protein